MLLLRIKAMDDASNESEGTSDIRITPTNRDQRVITTGLETGI